jgi:transcriptional regulator with XRE-family HTH domain
MIFCQMTIIDFSEWLSQKLKDRGWKASVLAEKADIDPAILTRALKAQRMPSHESLIRIARGLHLSVETVYQAAGLLPEKPQHDPTLDEVNFKLNLLPEEDQQDVLRYVDFLLSKREREGNRGRDTGEGLEPAHQ